jgi:hypothetical protein
VPDPTNDSIFRTFCSNDVIGAEISKKWMGLVLGAVGKEVREWHFFAM